MEARHFSDVKVHKLYNSVIRKYYKLTQERAYDVGRKSRMSEKYTPHMSERDLIDTLVYFVQEGAIVPTKKASNIKGGTSIMRKKRFNVRASMSAKRRNTVSASRMRSVRCARTSSEVDNVAVRELVLYITNDAKLYPNVLSIIENMKRKVKRGQYNDDLAIKAWQYLADDGVRKYDKEFGSNNGSVSMLNPATRKEIAKQLRDYYKDQVFEGVEASKSVRCSRTMRRPIKASESDRKRYNVVLSRDEANELKDFLRRNRIKFDSSGYGVNTYITFDLTKRESDMINDFLDVVADHATIDVEEYFERLPEVNSARTIKCAALSKDNSVDPIDSEFMVDLYYSPNHRGRAGDRYFYDWSEAESYAHDALMHGLYVSIWNKNNGDILDISPDEYNDAWENGAADFDINEDIVNFKRRIVESAKSIKCDDKIEDEITEDDSDLTIDISQLELSEPYYETREDDPENPDKWVLVIGKNPERHMNYKLWYYVDSTDADLTGLDLSNPDHIDIDEESTFEDYDDIQLSSDVSCCGDEKYSAGLVTM